MIDRRKFLHLSMLAASGSYLPLTKREDSDHSARLSTEDENPYLIDTNVNLFEWPFRHLKYSRTADLVTKLRKHRIKQAWVGSYEALLHKDLDGVNRRLAEECGRYGDGMLIPFGTINVAWPGWEENLNRCHDRYGMAGIRIYPGYQPFDLGNPNFRKMLQMTADRNMILQIACDMEDSRVHHPLTEMRDSRLSLLPGLAGEVQDAKIQLLYWNHKVSRTMLDTLIADTSVLLDTTRIESSGGVGRLIDGNLWGGGTGMPVPSSRILFGSHMPYFPVEANILKLFESPLPVEQIEAIMYGNANQLVGLKMQG